jgi:hypothetical protein
VGTQADELLGFSVSSAGDTDSDGYSDIVVGAPYLNNGSAADAGAVLVYYGSASGITSSGFFPVVAGQAGGLFGYSVGTAGDADSDGFSDIVVGMPSYDNGANADAGAVFVYYGSASGITASGA